MNQSHQRRSAIWHWRTKRLTESMPHIPAHLLEGLPEGAEVSPSSAGDPWNDLISTTTDELKPIIETILAEETGGPVNRPPFARPLEGGD